MTEQRLEAIEAAIAQTEAQGQPWTNQRIFRAVAETTKTWHGT